VCSIYFGGFSPVIARQRTGLEQNFSSALLEPRAVLAAKLSPDEVEDFANKHR